VRLEIQEKNGPRGGRDPAGSATKGRVTVIKIVFESGEVREVVLPTWKRIDEDACINFVVCFVRPQDHSWNSSIHKMINTAGTSTSQPPSPSLWSARSGGGPSPPAKNALRDASRNTSHVLLRDTPLPGFNRLCCSPWTRDASQLRGFFPRHTALA
jgi:hypothetical protein